MNILMVTNTYKPIMGGLEKSIEVFTNGYRKRGHRVIIIAPEFKDMEPEKDLIRVPAIQNFNGTDFSVQLPLASGLTEALGDFIPDIVHSHHPFLVGDTALRLAYKFNAPLVFTHHTLYEQNTHYVAGDSEMMKNFVVQLATGYANLVNQVFAPSQSVRELLQQRGVITSIEVVPTGIDLERFAKADTKKIRATLAVPESAFVIGHLGRLAPEKNLEFMARAVKYFLDKKRDAHFLVVGKGPSEEALEKMFVEAGLKDRLHLTGPLAGQELVDAYHAMDVFAFASQSETQGLVLAEAMASGVPVVAVDAPGTREVVRDKINGRLIEKEDADDFAAALEWVAKQPEEAREKIKKECLETAEIFEVEKSIERALTIYGTLVSDKGLVQKQRAADSAWEKGLRVIQAQLDLTKNLAKATTSAILHTSSSEIIEKDGR